MFNVERYNEILKSYGIDPSDRTPGIIRINGVAKRHDELYALLPSLLPPLRINGFHANNANIFNNMGLEKIKLENMTEEQIEIFAFAC